MSILDAIGTSIPIVATPVGGIADLLEDGHNSFMTEPGDDEALACALRRLMSDEAEMTRLVANMDVLKNGTLSVEHCGASMEKLLSAVIQG
jgi:glycosyltransferase involved in cell wall biosynthesis